MMFDHLFRMKNVLLVFTQTWTYYNRIFHNNTTLEHALIIPKIS